MTTCARCGLPVAVDPPGDGPSGTCLADVTRGTGDSDWTALACRDRELLSLRSLLRSVTGKLEEARELLDIESLQATLEVRAASELIDSVLEVLS